MIYFEKQNLFNIQFQDIRHNFDFVYAYIVYIRYSLTNMSGKMA